MIPNCIFRHSLLIYMNELRGFGEERRSTGKDDTLGGGARRRCDSPAVSGAIPLAAVRGAAGGSAAVAARNVRCVRRECPRDRSLSKPAAVRKRTDS